MLSKEEIENMKEDLISLYHMLDKKPSISTNAIHNALKYIDQLETREQKLIEKLEEDISKYPEARYTKWYLADILKILKGENHE